MAQFNNEGFQPRTFNTYLRDVIASDDAMHRRYNRWWSRFEQPDPYDGSYDLTNPQSFNRYVYTHNDPVNHVDPSGLDPEPDGGVLGAWLAFQIGQTFDVNVRIVSVIDTLGDGGDVRMALPPLGRLDPFFQQDPVRKLEQEIKAKEIKKIMNRLMEECISDAWNAFKAEASQIIGGPVEYVAGTWKAVLGVDVAEVALGNVFTNIAKLKPGPGFVWGVIIAGTYRGAKRHSAAASKLLDADAKYESEKQKCYRSTENFRSRADAEYANRR